MSLDEVAAHAGLTKGAIYGNFESKNDLVFVVTVERTSRAIPMFDGSASIREQLHAMIRHSFGRSPKARKDFAFLAEIDLYALTDEELAKRFMKFARVCHEQSAENVAQLTAKGKPPLAPLEFSIVVYALINALLFQHACYPDIVTEAVAIKTLDAILV